MGATSFQSCTNLVVWQLHQCNMWIMNYLDDFGGSPPHKAMSDVLALKNLLTYLCLPLDVKNNVGCLGTPDVSPAPNTFSCV